MAEMMELILGFVVMFAAPFCYAWLQLRALRNWRGGWRVVGMVPLGIVAIAATTAWIGLRSGENLAPLAAVFRHCRCAWLAGHCGSDPVSAPRLREPPVASGGRSRVDGAPSCGETPMKIAHRQIGPAHPPLVIAEIGINHGGSLDVAKEMVRLAASVGLRVHQAPDPFPRGRDDGRGQVDLSAQRGCLDLGGDGPLRPVGGRRGGAEDLCREPRDDLHLHAVQPARRRFPGRDRRSGVQDRIGRGRQPAVDPPHRAVRKAGDPVDRDADHRDDPRQRVDPRRGRGGLRAARMHQPLSLATRDREPSGRDGPSARVPPRGRRVFGPFDRAGDGARLGRARRLHPGAALYRHALPRGPRHHQLDGPRRTAAC